MSPFLDKTEINWVSEDGDTMALCDVMQIFCKWTFFLIVMNGVQLVQACQCVDVGMRKDSTTWAPYIFAGIVKNKNREVLNIDSVSNIRLTKYWKGVQEPGIFTPQAYATSKCQLDLEDGGEYLFLSLNNGEQFPMSICDTVAVPMSNAKEFLSKLGEGKIPEWTRPGGMRTRASECANREQSLWEMCKNDRDCLLVEGPCSAWKAVNRFYAVAARDYYACINSTLECPVAFPLLKPKLECKSHKCSIQ